MLCINAEKENIRMHKTAIAVCALICIAIGAYAFAGERLIDHPIQCYSKSRMCGDCPYDSTLVGKITYDPMPRYQKESAMDIEYYCGFDSDRDVLLRVRGEWWTYTISEYVHVWPGPVHKGDTLRARLTIKPLQVGGVRPEFAVIEQSKYAFPDSVAELQIPRAILRGHFMLGADGRVLGMNSVGTNEGYATFLGPMPEVMAESLIFWRDPKPPAGIFEPDRGGDIRYKYFALKTVLYTRPDDFGYLRVRCEVSPYHDYAAGIAFCVSADSRILIKDLSPAFASSAKTSDTIGFSFDCKATKAGLMRMTLRFSTLNPDSGNPHGIEIGRQDGKLSIKQDIYLGYDDNMTLLLTSGKELYVYLRYPPAGNLLRSHDGYKVEGQMDWRLLWAEVQWKEGKQIDYCGAGSNDVMHYGRR
jgi:hypothetical protein